MRAHLVVDEVFAQVIALRGRSARASASQKGIRKTPDAAPLPNLAVYENQGGAARAGAMSARPGLASFLHGLMARFGTGHPAPAGPRT